jgi:hypothetical protein
MALLMASFFGLGIGCILQEKRSLESLLPLGIVGLFAGITVGRGVAGGLQLGHRR